MLYIILASVLFAIAFLTLVGTGATAMQVGKPRAPLTSEQAGSRILLGWLYVAIFVWAGVLLILH